MSPHVLQGLCDRRAAIIERWEALLRVEPVNTALAHPDTLTHLIPASVAEVLDTLSKSSAPRQTLKTVRAMVLPVCGCNRNPYLSYFTAGEQALVESVVLLQAEHRVGGQHNEQDVAEAIRAVRLLAGSEIDTFCGICTHRAAEPGCRHYAAAV